MSDEIVGGSGGPPRRGVAVTLVLAAALLLGYLLTHRHPTTGPGAAARPTQPAQPAVPPVPRAAPRFSADGGPDLLGRVSAGPLGVRLLVDGTDPRIVDAHTLSTTPVPGLRLPPGQTAQVLQYGSQAVAALAPLYGPDGGIYLLRPGTPPLLFGGAGVYLPGRDRGLVVATYRPGVTTVTGFGLDRRVRWQWSLPGNVDPLRDAPAGLVVARYQDPLAGDAELLLDRRTGTVRRRLGGARYPLATDDRAIGWVPDRCAPRCPVVRTDLATGASRRYRMPAGREPVAGAFPPDGRRLALTFPGLRAGPRTAAQRGFVGVLDLRTGALAAVPGLATPPADHADVTWSADGRWLVLGVKWPEEELIALWRPGSEVTILPLALPGEPTNATLTAVR